MGKAIAKIARKACGVSRNYNKHEVSVMQRCKRILIFEFHQETNTFNPVPAGLDSFHPKCIFEGEDCFLERVKTGGVLQGACDAIIRSGGEVIPTVFMYAASGGRVEDAVYDHLCDRLKHYMETVGNFDRAKKALGKDKVEAAVESVKQEEARVQAEKHRKRQYTR